MSTEILWPTFALVLLIFAVWVAMVAERLGHFRGNWPKREDVAEGDDALSFASTSGKNFRALFELPVLYFALVPLLLLTNQGSRLQALLAWTFVTMRTLQSFVHIRSTKWGVSGAALLLSNIVLASMWIVFFVDMVFATGS